MNIIAISWKYKLLFIACEFKVSIFNLFANGEVDLANPKNTEIQINNNNQSINQIKVTNFDGDEVLLCVDNDAKYTIVKLNNSNFDKVILE